MKGHAFRAVDDGVATPSNRPLLDLIAQLPRCVVTATGELDYEASEPHLIKSMGQNAAQVMATMHMGLSAIGLLLANAAPEIETRSMSADVVEALGYLIAEIGDLAAQCDLIATSCRRYTDDYAPLFSGKELEPSGASST